MTDHDNITSPGPTPAAPQGARTHSKGWLVLAIVAIVAAAGFTGNMLTTALGQGFGWRGWHGWHDVSFMGPLTPAQIDDRIDRISKHLAIELDATADQQARIASIAKAAVADLRPLREKAEAARTQGLALLTAPTVDRAAIERLRVEQMQLAEAASKRIAQGLGDIADVLNPDQRRKIAGWAALFRSGGPWAFWHRG